MRKLLWQETPPRRQLPIAKRYSSEADESRLSVLGCEDTPPRWVGLHNDTHGVKQLKHIADMSSSSSRTAQQQYVAAEQRQQQ